MALDDFWSWYERHYVVNVVVAAALFTLQVVHLAWLTGDPVWERVFGEPAFSPAGPVRWPIVLVDYTEVPALVSVSLVYLAELRRGFAWRPAAFLVLLNSQWLHLTWITDEVVARNGGGMPSWLAWVAVLIDYLELPVLVDTVRRAVLALRDGGLGATLAGPRRA